MKYLDPNECKHNKHRNKSSNHSNNKRNNMKNRNHIVVVLIPIVLILGSNTTHQGSNSRKNRNLSSNHTHSTM